MKNKLIIFSVFVLSVFSANSQYCTPTYTQPCVSGNTNDLIDNFWTTGGDQDISNLNTSCNSSYINTGLALVTEADAVIGINVQCGNTYAQGFAIWIDWNQDFDFDDAGEKIYESPNSGFGVFTGTFTVPSDVECGDYRMRVRSKYASGGANINPCNNETYGEVEDYTVTIDECEPTICENETHTIDISNGLPPNVTSYSWSPATNISDPFGGPIVTVSPDDTTTYTVTLTSPDSVWTQSYLINVVDIPTPDAGLNDSTCYINGTGFQLNGAISNGGDHYWSFYQGPSGVSNAIFQPGANLLNTSVLTTSNGSFEFILFESDTNLVCMDGSDTVAIYFSQENHTTTFTDPTCFGFDDGSITITSTGTIGAVEYSFDGGTTFGPSATSSNFTSGVFTVVSRDIVGCEFSSDVTITDPAPVVLTVGPIPDSIVCENGTATLYASATNGVTFDFHWNHTTDLASTQLINPIGDSIVTVYAENELGCISETLPISISVYNPISLVITANDTVCPGYSSSHTVEALGGFQGYNYSWTANGVSFNSTENVINMNPNEQTEYCVTVTDGCETTPQTICSYVIMREVPEPIFTTDTTEGCVPSTIEFTNLTSYNLAETLSDSLNWIVDGTLYNTDNFSHLFENPGMYDVQLQVFTQYGCFNQITASEYIAIHEIPEATFYVISNPTTIFNTEVDMINNTQGDNNTYQWNFTGGIPATSSANAPTVLYPEGVSGDYPVLLYVTNEFNCTDSTTDIVHVISDVIIYAPNAFTPDGDAINNEWRVYIDGINVNDFHLLLFNRWGEVIWESFDPEASWNGIYAGGIAEDGTYVWSVVAKDASSDKKYEFRGTVSILR